VCGSRKSGPIHVGDGYIHVRQGLATPARLSFRILHLNFLDFELFQHGIVSVFYRLGLLFLVGGTIEDHIETTTTIGMLLLLSC